MTRSLSREHAVTCARCDTRFTPEVWLIVDSAERPDLWARCLDGSIHVPACPNGHPVRLDAPLLVHDADAHRLWFSPPGASTTEEAMAIGRELVDRLYEAAESPEALDAMPEPVDFVAYRLLPLELRRLPVPAALVSGGDRPGRDGLSAVLKEIASLTRPAEMTRRIQHCREALLVTRRRDEAEHWAWLCLTLADSLLKRLAGDRGEDVEEAICAYDAALEVYSREAFPAQWASVQNGLGNAHLDRVKGGRAANVARAEAAYDAALEVFTRRDFPNQWAMLQNNRGNAFAERVTGDRAQNVERAIEAYEAALQVRTRETLPREWAETMDNLGHALADRVLGDRAENLERAIQAYHEALTVRTPAAWPEDCAATLLNLGNAYAERRAGPREQNLDGAIGAYEAAAKVYTRDEAPERWAVLQLNLATVYAERAHDNAGGNVERGIEASRKALGVCTHSTSPLVWAALQNNLGTLYRERRQGDPAQNAEESIRAYTAALDVYADRLPNEARRVARNLAQVHIERQNWDAAHAALHRALEAADRLYGFAFTEQGRAAEIAENVLLHQQVVVICLRVTPARRFEAFQRAEEGRSRLLRNQLGTLPFPAPAEVPPRVLQKEAALLRVVRNCDNTLRHSRDLVDKARWVAEAEEARAALAALWDEISSEYAVADYVALRRGESISWADVQRCLAGGGC